MNNDKGASLRVGGGIQTQHALDKRPAFLVTSNSKGMNRRKTTGAVLVAIKNGAALPTAFPSPLIRGMCSTF